MKGQYTFLIISLLILRRMRNVPDKIVDKIKKTDILCLTFRRLMSTIVDVPHR